MQQGVNRYWAKVKQGGQNAEQGVHHGWAKVSKVYIVAEQGVHRCCNNPEPDVKSLLPSSALSSQRERQPLWGCGLRLCISLP